jgi:hypothetical protein
MKQIDIGLEFSDTPLGRYRSDGSHTGQHFREDHLVPALEQNETVSVRIDNTEGYGSSFLEEAFGGLVREGHFSKDQLREKLKIVCEDEDFKMYQRLIWKYIDDANPKSQS